MRAHPSLPRLGRLLPALLALAVAGCGDQDRARLEARLGALLEEAGRARTLPRDRVHPALLAQAHPVQLHRALTWLRAWGGNFRGIAPASFTAARRPLDAAEAEGGAGTARFEKGAVALTALFVGDQLAHLELTDELRRAELAAHLATAPADVDAQAALAEGGRDFWARALMGAEAKAFAMLHPGLQQALPGPEALRPPPGVPAGDAVEAIEPVGSLVDPEHPGKLHLLYRVRGAGATAPAHLTLQFVGYQVALVGFQLPSQLAAAPPVTGGPP